MKRLWSPWRMRYILSEEKWEGCIFCDKPAQGRSHDPENFILYRGQRAYLILNLYPYNNGHLMVVPYQHAPSLENLDAPTLTEMMLLLNRSLQALRQAITPAGFNIGVNLGEAAGAGITEHVHIHVVPRWFGDTNFMPVVADLRVIPELMENTYTKLQAALDDQASSPPHRDGVVPADS
jgi:ATP adenylyltransferase